MARYHVLGTSALVLGIGLGGTALAQDRPGISGEEQRGQGQQPQQQQQQPQQGRGRDCPACEKEAGYQGASQQGKYEWNADLGKGEGQSPQAQGGASIPQYWIADASLFIGNAANTAQTLAMEQGLNVASPEVLGNQAQFLVTAVNRALASLNELQQSAEASNPGAVSEIRSAIGHLVAAQAQAAQLADAANSGGLGPKFETAMRSTFNHLASAERGMNAVGRAYGQPALAGVTTCQTRAFGAGLGAQRGQKKGGEQAPSKGVDQQHKGGDQPQKGEPQKAPEQAPPKETP